MPSDPYQAPNQLPFRLLNVISVLKQTLLLQGVMVHWKCQIPSYQTPIRSPSDSFQIPMRCLCIFLNLMIGAYQIPIRSPSDSHHLPFLIPQRNLIQFGANQLPISILSDSCQKKFWFINAISILNQHTTRAAQPILIFVLQQPLLLRAGGGRGGACKSSTSWGAA